jgi:peptidoglycan/LPS O-acetylase OafA/YrhL
MPESDAPGQPATAATQRRAEPLVDWIKAVGSQLIVWHHLAFYGPMSDVVAPRARALFDTLYDDARLAVQAFLVVAGFLAARSMWPAQRAPDVVPGGGRRAWTAAVASRYRRLAGSLLIALALAVVAAALARWLGLPDAPAAPTPAQLLAHVFLLQDVLGIESLSAGIWYVAIDWQLYALLAAIVWAARHTGARAAWWTGGACAALTLLSLFWWNRQPALDVWALYFFGAYGLGIAAQRVSARAQRATGGIALAAIAATALWIEWRSRIAVAGATALLLAVLAARPQSLPLPRPVALLARISYEVFLVHYAALLAIGAIVHRFAAASLAANVAGLLAAWLLSLGLAVTVQRAVGSARLRWPIQRAAAGAEPS